MLSQFTCEMILCMFTYVCSGISSAVLSKMQQNSSKAYITYTQRVTFHYLRECDTRRSQIEMSCVLFQEHSLTNGLVAFQMTDMGSTP